MVSDRRAVSALLLSLLGACSGSTQGGATTTPTTAPTASEPTASPVAATEPATPAAPPPAVTTPAVTTPAATAPTATPTDPVAAAGETIPAMPTGLQGPPQPWEHMNHEARAHWMDHAVMPAMTSLLHDFSPQHFSHVTCATCHGENARAVNFHMPNTLPRLPAPGSPGWQHMMTEHPRMFEFMAQRVLPAQAQLLGVQPFNPQTHQGFGCFNCHPHEGS